MDGRASSAGLLSEELARGGFVPVLRRVETRADFESALAAESWDVVLADLAAPGLNAFEALDLLKKRDLDVPFVVVAEALVEDEAVRAMKEGAQNCIAHQNLARLAPILERELREAAIRRERRIAQQALSESELRLRGLAESAPDAILIADASGTLLFANRAAGRLFGHPEASLIGRPIVTLLPDDPLRDGGRTSGDVPVPSVGRHAGGAPIPLEIVLGELFRDGKPLTTVLREAPGGRRTPGRPVPPAVRGSLPPRGPDGRGPRPRVRPDGRPDSLVRRRGSCPRVRARGVSTHRRSVGESHPSRGSRPRDRPPQRRISRPASRSSRSTASRRGTGASCTGITRAPFCAAVDGRPARSIGTISDISGRRHVEEALQASERRYRALFERNLAGVYRTTIEGRILDCNESFARIFGYSSREDVLRQVAWDFYIRPEDRQAAVAKLVERQSLTNYELCLRRKDGSLVWVLQTENLVEGPDGLLSVIEGTIIDISERKRAEEQVKHLAFHDPLTNLPNRLLFNDRLTLAVAQAHRHNQRLAVLFLDLDRFKTINDSLGHSVGDELLRQVAERIQEHVREGDTVARLGGDEFTLLVPGITAEEDAAKIARKICEAIHDPFWIDGRELFVTTSVGVSVYPSDGHDSETLIRNADSAMYRAKEQGRDNYQLYTPAMNAKAVERLSLESRLRQAIANDELELHFQPFIDLRTAELLGAEALVRWRHPELGLIPPMDFIPIAELSGLIVPIGEWVLRTACAEARKWHAKGFQGLTVSVNLSSRQFQQSDLVSQVTHALDETGLEPDKLDLEITESNAMQNAEHSINTLWGLKKQGVRISMDDFGTGYSSLNYLKRFPIDRIKLDQSFVRDLPTDKDDAAIAMAVIAMGRSLELAVIAEGVETEEQLAFLKGHDCDQLQGFLLSKPLTPEAFDRFLDDSREPAATLDRARFARAH